MRDPAGELLQLGGLPLRQIMIRLLDAVHLPHRAHGGEGSGRRKQRAERIELPGGPVAPPPRSFDALGRALGGLDLVEDELVRGSSSDVRQPPYVPPHGPGGLFPMAAARLLQRALRGLVESAHCAVELAQQQCLVGVRRKPDRLLQQLVEPAARIRHFGARRSALDHPQSARLHLAELHAQIADHLDPGRRVARDQGRVRVDDPRLTLDQDGGPDEGGDHRHEGDRQDARGGAHMWDQRFP